MKDTIPRNSKYGYILDFEDFPVSDHITVLQSMQCVCQLYDDLSWTIGAAVYALARMLFRKYEN